MEPVKYRNIKILSVGGTVCLSRCLPVAKDTIQRIALEYKNEFLIKLKYLVPFYSTDSKISENTIRNCSCIRVLPIQNSTKVGIFLYKIYKLKMEFLLKKREEPGNFDS